MSRYIDADKINAKLMDEYYGMISDESMKIYKIMQMLSNAPTADVAEVKRGKWLPYGFGLEVVKCSICGAVYEGGDSFRFCPKCGARMDLEEENAEIY